MDKNEIIKLLEDYNKEEVENFASYCIRLKLAKKPKTSELQNPWIQNKTSEQMAILYKRVAKDGLVLDGIHITIQSTGISYDYIAYKNRMFLSYPESTIDVQLVHEGDEISFDKESGKVIYTHKIGNPFSKGNLIGAYCVIKNKRGEFLTTLTSVDIDKHRKVAKTDYIWKQWFDEMALKTIIKKAVKQHFSDIYQNIETIDNDNYELENPIELDLKYKSEIDDINNIEELSEYYSKNKGAGKEFDKYISIRKNQLTSKK